LFLASLSFTSCTFFIAFFAYFSLDSIIYFHCFLHLFQLLLVSSQLLIPFAHMPPTSLSVASRTSLFLIAFPSCVFGTFSHAHLSSIYNF
jgi:hypothetical protein